MRPRSPPLLPNCAAPYSPWSKGRQAVTLALCSHKRCRRRAHARTFAHTYLVAHTFMHARRHAHTHMNTDMHNRTHTHNHQHDTVAAEAIQNGIGCRQRDERTSTPKHPQQKQDALFLYGRTLLLPMTHLLKLSIRLRVWQEFPHPISQDPEGGPGGGCPPPLRPMRIPWPLSPHPRRGKLGKPP